MNGDEIDGVLQVAVAQPEFPDVGIGDRHRHLRLDLADDGAEVGRRQLAAQQHFIADDDGANDVGIFLGEIDGGRDLLAVERGVVGEPQPHQHLQAVALRRWRESDRGRWRSNRCGCSRCSATAKQDLRRSARRSPWFPEPADPGRRGTAHRKCSRVCRRHASGDGGNCTGQPSHHQAIAIASAVSAKCASAEAIEFPSARASHRVALALIRKSANRFSDKIMRNQDARAACRSRFAGNQCQARACLRGAARWTNERS